MLRKLLRGRIGVFEATYPDGTSVRRVERRRTVDWYVNGTPASEAKVMGVMRAKTEDLRCDEGAFVRPGDGPDSVSQAVALDCVMKTVAALPPEVQDLLLASQPQAFGPFAMPDDPA